MSRISILWKGNIMGKFRNVEDFHPLEREYNRKTSKRSKISIRNAGKNRICPSQVSKLLSITLIVWSGAILCGWWNFPSILVTVTFDSNSFVTRLIVDIRKYKKINRTVCKWNKKCVYFFLLLFSKRNVFNVYARSQLPIVTKKLSSFSEWKWLWII